MYVVLVIRMRRIYIDIFSDVSSIRKIFFHVTQLTTNGVDVKSAKFCEISFFGVLRIVILYLHLLLKFLENFVCSTKSTEIDIVAWLIVIFKMNNIFLHKFYIISYPPKLIIHNILQFISNNVKFHH